jgi:transcriptional regulator with XRE-family HTH domain
MNELEKLSESLHKDYPTAKIAVFRPVKSDGFWSIDMSLASTQLAIEWSALAGFGLSSVTRDTYGEYADERFKSLAEVKRRIFNIISRGEEPSPPFGVLLSRLRETRGVTQREVAEKMGIRQASISGMERRQDIQVSTLARLVEALDGSLEIYCVFREGRYALVNGAKWLTAEVCKVSRATSSSSEIRSRFDCLQNSGRLCEAEALAQKIKSKHSVLEMPR